MALTYNTPKRDRKDVTQTFDLDGQQYTARKPKDALSAMVLAASSDQATGADVMYTLFRWLDAALPEGDYQRLQSRLKDYDDDFDIEDLLDITVDVIQQFQRMESGQPYQPSGEPVPVPTPNAAPPRTAATPPAMEPAANGGVVKRRGRPPGSKNKPKTHVIEGQVMTSPARVSRSLPK